MEFTTFNKQEFVREVAKKTDWTLENSHIAIDTVFEVIREQILEGKIVSINGVGKFEPKVQEARLCVDLSKQDNNGKLLRDENGNILKKEVPARYKVKFRFIPSFKKKIKEVTVK